jgi:hypothetical protein
MSRSTRTAGRYRFGKTDVEETPGSVDLIRTKEQQLTQTRITLW